MYEWATQFAPGFIATVIGISAIWELIWKGIALWKSGRNNQIVWFLCILILNTLGILPIIYLIFFQKKIVTPIARPAPVKKTKKTVKKKKKK